MEKNSNTFTNSEEEPREEVELIDKKITELNNKIIKKEEREFILRLNLSKNQIVEITDDFIDFRNLVSLDMTENYLENITNLYYLANLEILILAKNFITNIGNVLTSLQKLQFLDLCFNKLEVDDLLIKSLAQNKSLFSLSLRGNENYDFERLKIKCLEFTSSLEILDTMVIYNKKNDKVSINSTVNYKTKKGEKVKIKTLKDYMNVRMKDLEENEQEKDQNFASNLNQNRNNFLKDSYIEEIKARTNIKMVPKSYYYYSNSLKN